MKKLILLLFIPLCFACSSDAVKKLEDKKNQLYEFNLNGKVKSLRETTYITVDTSGKPVRDVLITHYKHFFDEVGFYKKSEFFTESGRLESNWKYNYDDGILIESIEYDRNGVPLEKIKYKFDGYGNKIEENVYGMGGELLARVKYEYDKAGNMIETNIYKEEESVGFYKKIEKLKYLYDNDGNIIETYLYKEDESIEKLKHLYDNDGNLIEESRYNEDGELLYKWNLKYENFDSNNNWLKSIHQQDGKTTIIAEREIEYYD